MSKETSEWLNRYCLIGFTDKRGTAWHYKASDQGVEPNHYPQAIPVEDVQRRLFAWEAVEQELYISGGRNAAGDPLFNVVPDRKAIVTSDDKTVLGIFKSGYTPHQYSEWLIDNVANLLNHDTGLGIASAGLLRNRGQAWVQIEVPENVKTPEGVEFRPNLIAGTSFDGTLATTYKRCVTDVVCDNTKEIALGEEGQVFRVKHTRNSGLRIADAREALAIIETAADDFAADVAKLCAIDVTLKEWEELLNELVPVAEVKGRAQTIALNKRLELGGLYKNDPRCAPWTGTAYGVVQTFNTWGQHYATVKNAVRPERNFSDAIFGRIGDDDLNTRTTLAKVQRRVLTNA